MSAADEGHCSNFKIGYHDEAQGLRLKKTMTETIYNIFLTFADERCDHALYVTHESDLDDDAAVAFLQSRVDEDLKHAVSVPLDTTFRRQEYYARIRLGEGCHLYDEVFRRTGAGATPLSVTTIVIDGKPMINDVGHHGDPNIYLTPAQIGDARMDDWIIKYNTGGAFDLPQLIHDDYFLAIKLTFNAGLYVSATKLLVSCIDSIAYIEYGDERKFLPFVRWLKTYADLTQVGITAEELWELRNSLLHMTNLSSRKVNEQKVRRISFRVGGKPETDADGTYYFNFADLRDAFAKALGTWIESYNLDRSKFAKFVQRYDETISDSRIMTRASHSSSDG